MAKLMSEKFAFSRLDKVWIAITLCSLFAYVLYWEVASFETIYNSLLNGFTIEQLFSVYFISDVWATTIGSVLRLVGVSLALGLIYLVWGPKPKSFLSVRKKIAVAVLFEGIYFLSFLPITVFYLGRGFFPTLFIGYLLEIIAVFPLLAFLSIKIWRYDGSARIRLLKWISFAAIGYMAHIWVSNVFRWLSMVEVSGVEFLFQGIVAVGFFNSVVTLSLSLVFAVASCYCLLKKNDLKLSAIMFGIALICLGLHFVISLLYSIVIGSSLYSVLVIEIWPVTVLGLGISMLLSAKRTSKVSPNL